MGKPALERTKMSKAGHDSAVRLVWNASGVHTHIAGRRVQGPDEVHGVATQIDGRVNGNLDHVAGQKSSGTDGDSLGVRVSESRSGRTQSHDHARNDSSGLLHELSLLCGHASLTAETARAQPYGSHHDQQPAHEELTKEGKINVRHSEIHSDGPHNTAAVPPKELHSRRHPHPARRPTSRCSPTGPTRPPGRATARRPAWPAWSCRHTAASGRPRGSARAGPGCR